MGDCDEGGEGDRGKEGESGGGEGTADEDGNPGWYGGAADGSVSKALKLQRTDSRRAPPHPASPLARGLLGGVLTVQL